MKKSVLFVLVFCSATLISLQSARAFFLEPSLYYENGSGKFSSSDATYNNLESSVSGTGFGFKAGLSFLVPFVGVDLMYSTPSYSIEGAGLTEGNGTSVWAGVVGGAKLPLVGLRAWASYFPYGALTIGDDLLIRSGTALKFGIGWGLIPMVSFNLEYMMQSFDDIEDQGGAGVLPSADFTNNSLLFSLSVPI